MTDVLLVGTGKMGLAYSKALVERGDIRLSVLGRGKETADVFRAETGIAPTIGGIEAYVSDVPEHAIVAVDIPELSRVASWLLHRGAKHILLEKPGALWRADLEGLSAHAGRVGATVDIAYNRRFYPSIQALQERIASDGGLISLSFEFTEWPSQVLRRSWPEEVLERWILCNSTHVIDLAFHLAGRPTGMQALTSGDSGWSGAACYAGSTLTEAGVAVTYSGNLLGIGRWGLSANTARARYDLRPIEELRFTPVEQTGVPELLAGGELKGLKPGLPGMLDSWLSQPQSVCPLDDHIENWETYCAIAGVPL